MAGCCSSTGFSSGETLVESGAKHGRSVSTVKKRDKIKPHSAAEYL